MSIFNILIPCAGRGQRFADAGYTLPKPLIDIAGKPLIHRVIDSIGIQGQYIFCILKEHIENFQIDRILREKMPDCVIVSIDSVTQGAVSTCLLAEKFINNDKPLIIANSDQIIEFNKIEFIGNTLYYDGCTLTFPAFDSKWSFCLTDSKGRVNTIAEKSRISTVANCGVYSWKRGSDFVRDSHKMMRNETNRVNNEWYIATVFNETIRDGGHIQAQNVESMLPAGVPDDLKNSERIIKMRNHLNG